VACHVPPDARRGYRPESAITPLIDYQHPHDLFMALGGSYDRTVRAVRAFLKVDAVGSPALGPASFMHRPSAAENPTAPLSHHMLDSTHITPGVVTAGAERGSLTMAGSWFRGLEPDENRKDIDFGPLDPGRSRGNGGARAGKRRPAVRT
jgi:hypothetical protein